MFDLKIVGRNKVLFEGAAYSVFIEGSESEFELLSFHSPLLGVLQKGDIVIDNRYKIKVTGGLVSFHDNICYIITEEI